MKLKIPVILLQEDCYLRVLFQLQDIWFLKIVHHIFCSVLHGLMSLNLFSTLIEVLHVQLLYHQHRMLSELPGVPGAARHLHGHC